MSLEFILYSIGWGLPAVLVLLVSAAVGWAVKKETGALICSGTMMAVLNFGSVVREAGVSLTQEQSAIAAGAAGLSTVATFLLLYAALHSVRREAAIQSKIVGALGAMAALSAAAAGSMAVSLHLTGHPIWNDFVLSLAVYAALFVALAFVASEWQESRTKAADTETAFGEPLDQ